jgi:hypothetical protein
MLSRLVSLTALVAGCLWCSSCGAEPTPVMMESIAEQAMTGTWIGAPGEKPPDRGRGFAIHLKFSDGLGARVIAARIVVEKAEDDTGAALRQGGGALFYHEAVGRVDGDNSLGSPKQPLEFTLEGVTKTAKTLRVIEGTVEAIIPDNDPEATVTVEPVGAHLGKPIDSAALAQAGVSLTLVGENNTDADVLRATEEAKKKYGMGPPADLAQVGRDQLGTKIVDPEGRVVGMEFQARDGGSLRYNHNGQSHFDYFGDGHFHVFGIDAKVAADAKFVCWLITKKSLVKFPLKLNGVALPVKK